MRRGQGRKMKKIEGWNDGRRREKTESRIPLIPHDMDDVDEKGIVGGERETEDLRGTQTPPLSTRDFPDILIS